MNFFAIPPIDVSGLASELVSYVGTAATAGLVLLVAHYGVKVIMRAFRILTETDEERF
jgi:hypothetical protein